MYSDQKYNSFELESQQQTGFESNSNIFTNTRLGFIQKVYGILSFQILFTVLMCAWSMLSPSFLKFQVENYGLFIFFIVLNIIILLVLMCYLEISRKVPYNYILLGIFTFSESWIVSTVCGLSNPKVVFMAAAMTLGITVALTLYAITTKTDFTICGGLMFILGMVMLLFVIFGFFTDNKMFHVIICAISVVILGIYIIYDTQLIVGGRRESLDIDEYIIGALMLYVDIISLFLQLLELLKGLGVGND